MLTKGKLSAKWLEAKLDLIMGNICSAEDKMILQ